MALQWVTPTTATIKMDVALNGDGNIATGTDTAAAQKTVAMPGISSSATFAQANTVYSKIVHDILGATIDNSKATRTVVSTVADDGE